jgi:hypothetical protein
MNSPIHTDEQHQEVIQKTNKSTSHLLIQILFISLNLLINRSTRTLIPYSKPKKLTKYDIYFNNSPRTQATSPAAYPWHTQSLLFQLSINLHTVKCDGSVG